MIEQATNLSIKSFKNYTGPAEKFKKKNIVFGYNGRGKSSLAQGIKKEYLEVSPDGDEALRFFDKDYVDDNLRLQDPITGARSKNKIKGVIAQFSKKVLDNEDVIKRLKDQIIETKPIQDALDELKSETRKGVDAIHDRRKGTANISKKNRDFEIDKVIELYTDDLNNAKKIEADINKLSKIEGNNVIGEKLELIRTIYFENYSSITNDEITDASKVFVTKFEDINIPSSEIVEWLNVGVAIHEDGDKCYFCGGDLSLRDIRKRVEEYNENKKQIAIKSLQTLDGKLAELQNVIKRNLDKAASTKLSLGLDDKIDSCFTVIEHAYVGITNARNVIRAKIKNIDSKQVFIDFRDNLQKFNDAIEILGNVKAAQLISLETQNNNKDMLVKGAIGYEIINNSAITDKLREITIKTKELDNANATNRALNKQMQDLKQTEIATSDFASYISDILANLDIHLKLIVSEDDKNYVIQHTRSNTDLTIADISEGERNLLALLFFYYELFDDGEQQNFKESIQLIVIDDPISSMDDINKMYIIELMKQVVSLNSPQVFVLTHSWSDFTNLCYGYTDKPDTNFGFYEIKKDVFGNSLVQKTRSNISPYNHNFLEVYEFSQKTDTVGLGECEIYHMPNIVRQVLEGFLKFKIKDSSPTRSNEKLIAKVLYGAEWATIGEDKKTKLGRLLTTINVNSHDSSRSPDEILKAAKFLMTRISQVDAQHFNTYKEPID